MVKFIPFPLFILCITSVALHAQIAWDGGGGDTDYSNNLNWADDSIPGNSNSSGALIGSSVNQTVVYNTALGYTSVGTGKANSLLVGTGTNGIGSLTLSGDAGTLTFGGDGYGNAAWIGSSSAASAGTVTVNAGRLSITGGSDASINVGVRTGGTANPVVNGSLIINGGTVEVGRRILMGANSVNAIGLLTISSGLLDMKRTGSTAEGDLGMIRLGTGNNTVNFDGGTAILSGVYTGPNFASSNLRSTVFFNGTTLRANVTTSDFINGTTANVNLLVKNGGLIMDTNGFNVTINDALSNAPSSDGLLRKEGVGTLTLSAANVYSGSTIIEQGTLALAHASANNLAASDVIDVQAGATLNVLSLAGGALELASGQTLRGEGTVFGGLIVGNGGVISPGASPGTLTTEGQTWGGGGAYVFEFDTVDNFSVSQAAFQGVNDGADWLSIQGGLTILSSSFDPFVIRVTGLQPDDTMGPVADWNPMGDYRWNIATTQFGVLGFDPSAFLVDVSDFISNNSIALGREFSVSSDGSSVYLNYGVIPEPSTALLLLFGAAGLAIFRRK